MTRMRAAALRRLSALCVPAMLAACSAMPEAAGPDSGARLAAELPRHAYVLLGEVHDNADAHRLRAEALAQAVRAGWRPAIAMEQFDRERQADLDRALSRCADADCVIQAAGGANAGWDWPLYKPVLDLALREHLPVLAANLSRQDAAKVVRQGLDAVFTPQDLARLGLQGPPPAPLLAAQRDEVAADHCGLLPVSMYGTMATAQIARDAVMAQTMRAAASLPSAPPVVLLAGNGHVRKDVGVPRWLGAASLAVGFTEAPAAGRYDRDIVVAAAQREDPCVAMRASMRPAAAPAR